MNRLYLLVLLLLCACHADLDAQAVSNCPDCPKYDAFMELGKRFYAEGELGSALTEFQAAQVAARFCNCTTQEPADSITVVFDMIQKQRDDALDAKDRAEKARALAEVERRKAVAAQLLADSLYDVARQEKDKSKKALEKATTILSYIPFFYDKVAWGYNKETDKYCLIDTAGTQKTAFIYDIAGVFNDKDSLCITSTNGKKILLDIDGKVRSEGDGYDQIKFIKPGRYKADQGFLIKLYTESDFTYFDYVEETIPGIAKVGRDNNWNFINDANKILLENDVDAIGEFNENRIVVKNANGWYYLDTNLQIVKNKYFSLATDFAGEKATVIIYGLLKTIDLDLDTAAYQYPGLLNLGDVDRPSKPANQDAFFAENNGLYVQGINKNKFRDENRWKRFETKNKVVVYPFQQLLNYVGFLPEIRNKGIFDYYTQSAGRLFQENIRTVLRDTSVGIPDGDIGRKTFTALKNVNFSVWDSLTQTQTTEYDSWRKVLESIQQYYLTNPSPALKALNTLSTPSDTRRVGDWCFDTTEVQLIGIRRNEDKSVKDRGNDDLFILLINGMVFKFWGSTDPNPAQASRADIPFLSEGQHAYKVGWTQIGDIDKIGFGLIPASNGVFVFRDGGATKKKSNGALDASDIQRGLDADPNPSITVSWTGNGALNFSAGSQVIAGASYINQYGQVVDCSDFAARDYEDLTIINQTKAAYNVFMDLILTYGKDGLNTNVYYTLLNEDVFNKVEYPFDSKPADIYKKLIGKERAGTWIGNLFRRSK
jgi:hypothetical protein